MEQCIQMLAQAIQSGQLDPQTPIGAIVEQAMAQAQPEQAGLGTPAPQQMAGM